MLHVPFQAHLRTPSLQQTLRHHTTRLYTPGALHRFRAPPYPHIPPHMRALTEASALGPAVAALLATECFGYTFGQQNPSEAASSLRVCDNCFERSLHLHYLNQLNLTVVANV